MTGSGIEPQQEVGPVAGLHDLEPGDGDGHRYPPRPPDVGRGAARLLDEAPEDLAAKRRVGDDGGKPAALDPPRGVARRAHERDPGVGLQLAMQARVAPGGDEQPDPRNGQLWSEERPGDVRTGIARGRERDGVVGAERPERTLQADLAVTRRQRRAHRSRRLRGGAATPPPPLWQLGQY